LEVKQGEDLSGGRKEKEKEVVSKIDLKNRIPLFSIALATEREKRECKGMRDVLDLFTKRKGGLILPEKITAVAFSMGGASGFRVRNNGK